MVHPGYRGYGLILWDPTYATPATIIAVFYVVQCCTRARYGDAKYSSHLLVGNVIYGQIRIHQGVNQFPHSGVPLWRGQCSPKPDNRHPIARQRGRGMGCLLWVWSLIFKFCCCHRSATYIVEKWTASGRHLTVFVCVHTYWLFPLLPIPAVPW